MAEIGTDHPVNKGIKTEASVVQAVPRDKDKIGGRPTWDIDVPDGKFVLGIGRGKRFYQSEFNPYNGVDSFAEAVDPGQGERVFVQLPDSMRVVSHYMFNVAFDDGEPVGFGYNPGAANPMEFFDKEGDRIDAQFGVPAIGDVGRIVIAGRVEVHIGEGRLTVVGEESPDEVGEIKTFKVVQVSDADTEGVLRRLGDELEAALAPAEPDLRENVDDGVLIPGFERRSGGWEEKGRVKGGQVNALASFERDDIRDPMPVTVMFGSMKAAQELVPGLAEIARVFQVEADLEQPVVLTWDWKNRTWTRVDGGVSEEARECGDVEHITDSGANFTVIPGLRHPRVQLTINGGPSKATREVDRDAGVGFYEWVKADED